MLMANRDSACYNAIKPCQKLHVSPVNTKHSTTCIKCAWIMICNSKKHVQRVEPFLTILVALVLDFDHNVFLSMLAICLDQEKALNSPGRLISVLSFFPLFSILHRVFLQQFFVSDFRLSFSTYSGVN